MTSRLYCTQVKGEYPNFSGNLPEGGLESSATLWPGIFMRVFPPTLTLFRKRERVRVGAVRRGFGSVG